MAHLPDYVLWRGDLSFREREFRTEDNLVFSELVYIDYKPVLGDGVSLSLREAVGQLDAKGLLKNTRAVSGKEDEDFARYCGMSKRFGDVILSDFEDIYDSSDRQFAALTYTLDDGTTVIGFRGTDATITGWKEDFMISYTNVPSQDLALEYAMKHTKSADGRVIILGHSKGAHLSLYSAAHLDRELQDKLCRVYLNDGPGFCEDVLNSSLVERISGKLVRITPEYSIIGRIFEPKVGESIIVRSSGMALMQHNIQSWLMDGDGLSTVEDHSPESHLITDLIHRFVEGMDLDARENFIGTLFGSMSATGARTIKEFAQQGPAVFEELLIKMAGNDALNLKEKSRNIKRRDDDSKGLFVRLWGLINRKQFVRIVLSILLSVLCFTFPDFAMESVVFLVLVIACIYEVILTFRHLRESEWNFTKERTRVLLCIVLIVITSAVIVKRDALFVVSSMIVGCVLLALAYQNVINFRIYNNKFFERFRYTFEGIVCLLLGVYILNVPEVANSWYMLSCGFLLMIDAIFETLKMIRDRNKSFGSKDAPP